MTVKRRRAQRPLMSYLRVAHLSGERETEYKLVNEIKRDSWQAYLNYIRPANITSIYMSKSRVYVRVRSPNTG